jgi:hypothetical protein
MSSYIAQRGEDGPNHVISGRLKNMCVRREYALGKYMCVYVSIFSGILSTVRYFHFII